MQNAAVISAEMLTDSLHDTAVYSSMDTSADSAENFCKLGEKSVYAEKHEFCLHHILMGSVRRTAVSLTFRDF